VLFAYRDGSTTPPDIPSGQNWTTVSNTAGDNDGSHVVVAKLAASSSEASGTFTNASSIAVLVLRAAGLLGVGAAVPQYGTTLSAFFPGLTLDVTDGSSYVVGFIGARTSLVPSPGNEPEVQNAPSGLGNETAIWTGTNGVAAHITPSGVTSWSSTNVSLVNAADSWGTHSVEITLVPVVTGTGDAGTEVGVEGDGSVIDALAVTGTGEVGTESGVDASGTITAPLTGTASLGTETGASGAGRVPIAGTATLGTEAGVTASGDIIPPVPGTASLGTESGVSGSGTIVDPNQPDSLLLQDEPFFFLLQTGGNLLLQTAQAVVTGNASLGTETGSDAVGDVELPPPIPGTASLGTETGAAGVGAVRRSRIPRGRFTGAEIWSDVECNGGVRIGWLPVGTLAACSATWTTDNRDQLSIAAPLYFDDTAQLTRGRVVRIKTDDVAEYEEWRILDTQDDSDTQTRTARCDGILQDLARAVYTAYDGTGQPQHEFSAIGVDVEGIIDGPVLESLADAGITYIGKGTIDPVETFDVDADYATARSLIADAAAAVGAEVQVRRNGTTSYLLDVVQEIGASAPMAYARTARNLLTTQRQRNGSLGGTRVVPRGADDSTSRGIGYAYWEVTDVTGSVLTLRDPRGAGFPSPLPFQNMAAGWLVFERGQYTPLGEVVSSVDGPTSGLSRVTLDSAAGFTAGMLVEFAESITTRQVEFVRASKPTSFGQPLITGQYLLNDVILVWDFNFSNTAIPALPSGYTSLFTASGASSAVRLSWKRAAGNGSESITVTGEAVCQIYRNVRAIGALANGSGTGAAITYPALSLQRDDGSSWVVAFGSHRGATNVEVAPTGLTNRIAYSVLGESAGFDTDDGVSAWPSLVQSVNASAGWRAASVELLADFDAPRRLWHLDNPAAQTAQAGVYDRILDRPTLTGAVNYAGNPFVRDFTGSIRLTNINGNGGVITASTSSPTVTGLNTWFPNLVQPGDRIYLTTGNVLVGTVQSVTDFTTLTLTANALVNATDENWTIEKDAPVGTSAVGQGANVFTEQVDSDAVLGAKAWRIYRPAGRIGSATVTYRLPTWSAPETTNTPQMYWLWCDIRELGAGTTLTFRLYNAADNGNLSDPVELISDEANSLVRVMMRVFDSVTFNTPIDVYMTLEIDTNSSDQYDVRIGPWGAQPAGWAITDLEAPRACDLWHEGTLWLATQSVPESYNVGLADLATIDGIRFPFEQVTLGGRVTIDDRELGISSVQRVVSLTRDFLRPGDVQLVLGRRERGLAEFLASGSAVSVADVALRLSRGLLSQAAALASQPFIDATPDGNVVENPATVSLIGGAIRNAFRS
jgi:hypothetical protein